jgi:hypothetical protein
MEIMNKRTLLLKYLNNQTSQKEEETVHDLLIRNDMETKNFLEIFWIGGPDVKLLDKKQTRYMKQNILDRMEAGELETNKKLKLFDEAK